jgi:putative ABC transport system permease protein
MVAFRASALLRKLLRDTWRWRGQILAIVVIIGCGIGTFVAFASVSGSLQSSLDAYYDRYGFADVFDQLTRAPDLVRRTIQGIPGVAAVQTRVVEDVIIDIPGRTEPAVGRVISLPDEGPPTINGLHMNAGRYVRPGAAGEVIVSQAFAEGNGLSIGSSLGAVLNGRWQQLRIVGIAVSPEYVYEVPPGGQPYPDPAHFGVLWMGDRQVSSAFQMYQAFNDVSLRLAHGASVTGAIVALDNLLDRYGGVGAYDRNDQPSARLLSDALVRLNTSAVFIAILFLSIAAFLLNVLLLRLIRTQRDQIAVLKAFGFSNLTLGLHYLGFVAVIVLLGAILGAGLGIAWGQAFTREYSRLFFHLPTLRFASSLPVFVEALMFCAIASVIGALAAVREAVRLAPAEAMRPEAPETYRQSTFERLTIKMGAPLEMRIVSRNIEHKPLTSALSILGVALAIALLILARYLPDATDRIFDILFNETEREDATISFVHALAPAAVLDVAKLPGVLHVEAFRSVAARVSYASVSQRVAITGLQQGGRLRRIVDLDGQVIPVPREGVVISKTLARSLRIPVGAMLDVDVLEGRRQHVQLRLVDIVDEFSGTSVYCDMNTLDRLLDHGGQVSGAYLALDSQRAGEFDAAIKRVPEVSGVSLREASMHDYTEVLAQAMRIDESMVFLFACVIAFGVAYNTARIALSERTIELSSLRILGFTRAETWRILVGEQLFFILAAAVPGIVAGALFTRWLAVVRSTRDFTLPWVLTPSAVAFALGFVVVVTAISSLIVRRQIDRLDIVSVLKTGD